MKEKLREIEHSGCISYHDRTKTVEASKPNTNKWVINLSNTPLTEDQESLLKHGPNFAVTPQRPPLEEYIKAIETACQSLDAKSAEELRSDVYRVLRHPCQLKPNLSKGEMAVIKQLRADKDRIILTADKGVALGDYGERGLYLESPAVTTRSKHLPNHSNRPHHKIKEQIDHQTEENQA